jgi:hypothetical protein
MLTELGMATQYLKGETSQNFSKQINCVMSTAYIEGNGSTSIFSQLVYNISAQDCFA